MEVKVLRIFVLPWHAGVKGGQTVPADAPFDLIHRFGFTNQHSEGFAIQRVSRLQLPDRQG
jgi:hypothetical protein